MYYNAEELKAIFKENKRIIDEAYLTNKIRYGDEQANVGMYEYFVNYRTDFITRSNNARKNMEKFQYHAPEIEQFLIEYAMSSYITNNIECPLSYSDIRAYTDTENTNLKYDPQSIISLVALGAAYNTYWMSNVIACNKKVKSVLVESLINERYIENKKEALDNSPRTKLVHLKDGKSLTISINKLNLDIDNMIRDDEGTYFKDDTNDYSSKRTR